MLQNNADWHRFVDPVRKFCHVVSTEHLDLEYGVRQVEKRLAVLYSEALSLPPVTGATFEEIPVDKARISSSETAVRDNLFLLLPRDLYWQVYSPFGDTPEEPVCSSLVSDLTEIWYDLAPGLAVIDAEPNQWAADVFWDWQEGFRTHWATHAVDALSALHKLRRDS